MRVCQSSPFTIAQEGKHAAIDQRGSVPRLPIM